MTISLVPIYILHNTYFYIVYIYIHIRYEDRYVQRDPSVTLHLLLLGWSVVFHHRNTSKNWAQKRNTSHCGWIAIALQPQFGPKQRWGKEVVWKWKCAEVCMSFFLCVNVLVRRRVGLVTSHDKFKRSHPQRRNDPMTLLLQVKEKTFATRCVLTNWTSFLSLLQLQRFIEISWDCPLKFAVLSDSWKKSGGHGNFGCGCNNWG